MARFSHVQADPVPAFDPWLRRQNDALKLRGWAVTLELAGSRVRLRASILFIGSTSTRGASTHFGKVTRPDGVMLQLGQRSSERDVWLWVPAGTSHNQSSPWSSPLALSHWRECNELHFISGLPPGGLPPQGIQLITSTADFIRHFPAMSAMGVRQHPQQGPLLSGSGGGGGTGGEGGGEGTGGGPTRPASGLLWPRGM